MKLLQVIIPIVGVLLLSKKASGNPTPLPAPPSSGGEFDDFSNCTDCTRGIRNNNPGNIEKGDNWQGMKPNGGTDSRFIQFEEFRWGVRALIRVLKNYKTTHGINTINGIISRWSPPSENNTAAYISAVENITGIGQYDTIDTHHAGTNFLLAKAIVSHENSGFTLTLTQHSLGWEIE